MFGVEGEKVKTQNMGKFDFVTDSRFRQSLERDDVELNTAIENGGYKSALVLAGSILEAILSDYLLLVGYKERDPLTLSLHDLVMICQSKGIITEKAANLSTVVREYRNLIHPSRQIRTNGVIDKESAEIAKAVVTVITREIVAKRKEEFGLTAEQVIAKLERDTGIASVLGEILVELNPSEIDRLVLELLPKRYIEIDSDSFGVENVIDILNLFRACFKEALKQTSVEGRKKLAENFVRILKTESSYLVGVHRDNFFDTTFLEHNVARDRDLVCKHICHLLKEEPRATLFTNIRGITKYLSVEDSKSLLWYAAWYAKNNNRTAMAYAEDEYNSMTEEQQIKVKEYFLSNIEWHRIKGREKVADGMKYIFEQIELSIPF